MEDKEVTLTTHFLFLLFVIFLTLKLTGYITWSWWIVTLPLWIGPACALGILGICFIVVLIIGIPLLIYEIFNR